MRLVWLTLAMGLAAAPSAFGVQFTLASNTAATWTYPLTYDPLDNYGGATITLSGLSGAVSATGPTSTDFAPPGGGLDIDNLAWIPSIAPDGKTVTWTNNIGGTGNFPVSKHAFGFSITAPGMGNGTANIVTSGFYGEIAAPLGNRDIATTAAGPVSAAAVTIPEPATFGLVFAVLLVAGARAPRRQVFTDPT